MSTTQIHPDETVAPVTADAPQSQLTAPIATIEAANGVTYAFRRFGARQEGRTPVLFLQHFRGNLDNWDPLLVDAVAANTELILVDNTGVGSSSGQVPLTVTEMGRDAIASTCSDSP